MADEDVNESTIVLQQDNDNENETYAVKHRSASYIKIFYSMVNLARTYLCESDVESDGSEHSDDDTDRYIQYTMYIIMSK